MMSSEEETDCFALYGATTDSKQQQQLLKKQKRTRQRVDAGEPRNSYSSIPNFSSRPSFLNGGLYGAIFSSGPQQIPGGPQGGHLATTGPTSQHSAHTAFGFFGAPGFGPAKMLNELLGRQVKQASDAGGSPPEGSHVMTGAGMDSASSLQPGAAVNCDDPATAAELTQHMLRDILQGRKLAALSAGPEQPNNNNSIHSNNNNNNNNNNTTTELLKSQQHQQQNSQQQTNGNSDVSARGMSGGTVQSGGEDSGDGNNMLSSAHVERDVVMPGDAEDSAEDAASAARAMEEAFAEAGMEPGANLDGSDCEPSLPPSPSAPRSVSVSVKEELQDSAGVTGNGETVQVINVKRSLSNSPCPVVPKTEASSPSTEIKRARVENIVSTMRCSPALQPPPVNGCKKRKLYHPQQQQVHHVLQHGVVDVMMDDEDDSDEDEDPATIRQKRVEKDALKSQLRTMQEQLAEMQQKYVQLCSRMEAEAGEGGEAPASPQQQPQPPPRPPRPHPPPFSGLATLPPDHPHATAAVMYHMGQKLYLEQQHAALERMKQHQEAAVRQQQHHQQQQAQQQQQHQQQQQQNSPQPSSQSQQQQQNQNSNTAPATPQTPRQASTPLQHHKEFHERLNAFRGAASSSGTQLTGADLEGLADILKTEITSSLTNLIDSIVSRFFQQQRILGKQSEAAHAAAEQLNKDLLLASQLLERKSPRTKVVDRGAAPQQTSGPNGPRGPLNGVPPPSQPQGFPQMGPMGPHGPHSGPTENNLNQINQLPPHIRSSSGLFQTPKPPTIYAMASMQAQQQQQQREQQQREQAQREQYCNMRANEERDSRDAEQNEALSLVMTPKKKRHKVTDTRITPRTVSRILAQENNGPQGGADSPPPPPPPRPYHAPPPMLPVSLPTSVAIPNPSLHESQVFSPYSPFFNPHGGHPGQVPPPGPHHLPASPPGGGVELRDSPPLPHPPAMLHPALLAAAQHGSPDYGHLRMDSNDRGGGGSDCNSGDISYDGIQPTSSTLTPMHLRKAKLMFFWVRYPSSAVLKMYFPDIKFNKNNTAQLVKWFSNFREFYYIQMEKYARQAVSEGVKNADDLHVGGDSEIYRVLNLHYNRNNHIEVPGNFRFVVEQTLKEFFKAIQGGKDSEQSWKKSIYKVISRLDDPVPEYFKSPNFLEQLE